MIDIPGDSTDFRPTANGTEVLFLRVCYRYGGFSAPKRDHLHTDRREWIDEESKHGTIRTRCRRCGALIGYRPAEAK